MGKLEEKCRKLGLPKWKTVIVSISEEEGALEKKKGGYENDYSKCDG